MVICSIDSQDSIHNFENIAVLVNNGSLSGFVNDSIGNFIEGVRVRVDFHETFEEDFTDESGYYHVTNIPECYCLKNVTVSKIGYKTEKVTLSISNNSTYDFILTHTNFIYVDDDGGADYTKIQNAIDNATNGDTIFVYSGVYYENIIVNKTLELIGENKISTIINAENNGDVISIYANDVHLTGFTILNSGKSDYPFYEYQGIFIDSNSNIVRDNIIYNSEEGIYLNSSYGNIITENVIEKSNSHSIKLYRSNFNIITYNAIFNFNNSGITLVIADENWILHNAIKTGSSYGTGIVLSQAKNNKIIKNAIIENRYGIELNHDESKFNNITMNNFLDNDRSAKFYALSPDSNNIWDGNYWDHARILPKLIFGSYHLENNRIWLHWFNIDWHPAREPFDI